MSDASLIFSEGACDTGFADGLLCLKVFYYFIVFDDLTDFMVFNVLKDFKVFLLILICRVTTPLHPSYNPCRNHGRAQENKSSSCGSLHYLLYSSP